MAVFTEVSFDEAAAFLRSLNLGQLQSIKGAAGGIENTNYFVDTDQGQYVLTLFERLTFEQLPFYLHLMKHLAGRGIPVPDPVADASGAILHRVKDKPAAVVNKLRGHSELAPTPAHCASVGEMLARLHLAGLDYPRHQPNLRGLAWWNETVPVVLPHLTEAQRSLILDELAYQNEIAASAAYDSLPRGAIHADLFRDNVMFEDGRLTGFFDFYFAGCDTFVFDIGICLNDWCIDLETGAQDAARADAFMAAYQRVRPLSAQERTLLPALQRAGALRFWISRLWDFHLPREAAVLKAHDPGHFERVLRQRLAQPDTL
ncbi:MAG: homoserine kinase [Pseudomonadota bacterium]|nr:homoserine kinase [Pseudomonadota bacterium]